MFSIGDKWKSKGYKCPNTKALLSTLKVLIDTRITNNAMLHLPSNFTVHVVEIMLRRSMQGFVCMCIENMDLQAIIVAVLQDKKFRINRVAEDKYKARWCSGRSPRKCEGHGRK